MKKDKLQKKLYKKLSKVGFLYESQCEENIFLIFKIAQQELARLGKKSYACYCYNNMTIEKVLNELLYLDKSKAKGFQLRNSSDQHYRHQLKIALLNLQYDQVIHLLIPCLKSL